MERKPAVLIVDDDTSQTRTMSLILTRKGYEVATARDGFEAIVRVRERPFDVIFMDIKMPVMNGVEAYKEIKKIRPEAVVMMMTAYAVEELIQEALREGVGGVLYKPIDIDSVTALIDDAMKSKNGGFILVVDDDESTCVTLKNILTRKGYETGIAHTGEEAVRMAKKKKYRIIFIDMKLPTINGLETYLAIKKVSPETVAIMITAYRQQMEELVDKAIQNDAYTCIYKPLDIEVLLGMVEEIIQRKHRKR
jgi:two-component system response regulator HydG